MTIIYEVICVNKTHRSNPHERITHIGVNCDGTLLKITQQQAIDGIESRRMAFYVNRDGHQVNVIVSTSIYGHKYIKTVADSIQPDNLLSLPECN